MIAGGTKMPLKIADRLPLMLMRARYADVLRPEPEAGCRGELICQRRFQLLSSDEARAGDAEVLGRALESCREYLLLIAARGLDADLIAKGGASDLVQDTLLGAYRDFGSVSRPFAGRAARVAPQDPSRTTWPSLRRRYRGTRKRQVALEIPIGGSPRGTGSPMRCAAIG